MTAMQQKTAAIVVIGNEILTGKSEDRNASFLIGELYGLGVALRRIVVIPTTLMLLPRPCASAASGSIMFSLPEGSALLTTT